MSQIKFQNLINDFSVISLADVLKGHDFFRIKQNLLPAFGDKQFIDFTQLGDFDLEDDTNIIVICARSLTPLNERASRKTQYDISKKILKNFLKSRAGMFVYYDNKGDFRISLVYADYVGVKVNYSTFRRFTYFVSKQQTNTTFLQQVASLDFTNFTELKEMFSVEKVTKEFFKKYRDLFLELLEDFEQNEEFKNAVVDTNISTTPDFVKKLMGQIVFLYFVQKKGWLGVRPDKNWGSGDSMFLRTVFENCKKAGKNYYNDYLEPLFYEALAEKRGEDDFFGDPFNCRIPFLNGGLFESIYKWETTEINIHNEVLGKLLDFFDQYNFTVDENTPSDQEISVDPEMLGKIFENLLEVKDRKDKGAFYTPREIVHYMCRESLIQHLVSENTAPEERIRKIFDIKDTDLSVVVENEEKTKRIKELKEISEKIDTSLCNIKIVDPAVGSGAFPMGMLNEISSVRYFLNSNFLHKLNNTGKELTLYDIKKETLENCIYAVDIEPGAVEIAKLRFWLALIVEYESNDSNIAPPTLPNLDYKIMQGNSLLEEYEGIKLFDEKIIKTIDTNKEKQIEEIKQKQSIIQKEYFDLHSKNKLTPIKKVELDTEAKKLNDQLKKLSQVDKNNVEKIGLFDLNKNKESKIKADELKSLQKQFFETSNPDNKKNIKKQIEDREWDLIETTLREEGKISELNKIAEFKKSKTKPFFLWKLHFADVFEKKGGFDIVIGNPPYVGFGVRGTDKISKSDKEDILRLYPNSAEYKINLYPIFIEKALTLCKNNGVHSFIVPDSFLLGKYFSKIRKHILNTVQIIKILLFSEPVFDAVVGYSVVYIFLKTKEKKGNMDIIKVNNPNLASIKPFNYSQNIFEGTPLNRFRLYLNEKEKNLVEKIEKQKKSIKDLIEFKSGLISKIGQKEIVCSEKKNKEWYPGIVSGGEVGRYSILWEGNYIRYNKEFIKSGYGNVSYFEDKIFVRQTGDKIISAFDNIGYLCLNNVHVGNLVNEIYTLSTITSILNSKLINKYYEIISLEKGRVMAQIDIDILESIPVPVINKKEEDSIKILVDQITVIKKQNKDDDTKKLEHQIDELVYRLYDITDPEEIKLIEDSSKK